MFDVYLFTMILSVNHFILPTNLSYWQNGFFGLLLLLLTFQIVCWLESFASIHSKRTDSWVFWHLWKSIQWLSKCGDVWHKHNCKHATSSAEDFRSFVQIDFIWHFYGNYSNEYVWLCVCVCIASCTQILRTIEFTQAKCVVWQRSDSVTPPDA